MISVAPLSADIKTQEKTSFQMGGMLGGLINRFAGDAAKDGVVSSVAVHGTRKMTSNEQTGKIIDLAEERVYDIDYRRKEYRVTTFAELRKRWQDAQEKAKKDVGDAKGSKDAEADPLDGKQYEISFDVKQTGQTKSIAGHNTREAIVTITVHEKGKSLEDGGGMVMTNDMWIAPKISEMDEIAAFDIKFAKAIYGDAMPNIDAAQMSMLLASYPAFKEMSTKAAAEAKKLEGTPLAVVTTLEAVKSAEQMKAQASAGAAPSPTGGLAGRLAARMGPKPKPGEQKTKAFTSSNETISISTSVVDADTALPAGFKEKK